MLDNLRRAFADFRAALQSDANRPTAESEQALAAEAAPDAPEAPATPGPEAGLGPSPAVETAPAAAPRRLFTAPPWLVASGVVGLVTLAFALARWGPWAPREPADPAVVATYQGGIISADQLKRQFEALPKADQPFALNPNGLKSLVGDLVVHEVSRRWAEERQVDQKQTFKEAMKHATERVQLADVSDQLHQGRIQVGQAEIQAYYDQNRQRFGERPLVEVQDQIRRAVVEQKEQAFIDTYLKDLKERASLQVDYSLLEVPEPTEQELTGYYQANRARFRVPEQARVAQIQVSVSLAGGDEQARAKAESVRARVAAGEDFTQLHHELSSSPDQAQAGELPNAVARGSRTQAFDEAVFPLPVGALSPVFKEGDSYYVVKLLERWPEGEQPFDEVRGEIVDTLRAEREQQVYTERKDRTLFTIHSRRVTLGEFQQELDELPPEARAQYDGLDGKRRLLDGLIERLLVVEDASEQAVETKNQQEVEHARSDLLARLLHQEQVDEQLQVGDAEIQAEYNANRERYADPAQVKVRYIRVSRGRTTDEDQRARAKIDEALARVKPGGLFGQGAQPADFGEVTKQYSEDPETAAKGGELDTWLGEGPDPVSEMLQHALHEQLLPLKVGELSPVLPLGDSYYLFQIQEKQEARQRSLEEATDLVREQLEARKHTELTRNMQRQLLDRMQLQIYDSRIQGTLAELNASAAEGR